MVTTIKNPALIGKNERGTDFNFYQEVVVSGVTEFPDMPQAIMGFRGPRRMMFICPSGTVEYSFNGNTVHGKAVNGEPSERLDFGTRAGDKIWVRGTGTLQIHCWHIGV
jgi:hypothetical protein